MRFALLGDHVDGLAAARALADTGRYEWASYNAPSLRSDPERFAPLRSPPQYVPDVEEILADPALEVVVVASRLDDRPAHLRRALQSERHVLCVHPADLSPDMAYEAALIQSDTHKVLLPLLPGGLHPAIRRLGVLIRDPAGPVEHLQLVEVEGRERATILLEADAPRPRPALSLWPILRALGGEIAEVSAFALHEPLDPLEPLLLCGRFEKRGLWQMSLLPGQVQARWRITASGSRGEASLLFWQGLSGDSQLVWQDRDGKGQQEVFPAWNPWPAVVEALAASLSASQQPLLAWQDAIRAAELDDATRRSLERRRTATLEYPEATEETGFKGTMTLVGCGLLWIVLLLLIGSIWVGWLGWGIFPVLLLYLILQLTRWLIPAPAAKSRAAESDSAPPS